MTASANSSGELLPVVQADRDAAAKRLEGGRSAINTYESHTIQMVRAGKMDRHAWVQAFAGHRLASTPTALTSAEDALREALVDNLDNMLLAAVIKANQRSEWRLGSIEWRRETAGDIADAILALQSPRASDDWVKAATDYVMKDAEAEWSYREDDIYPPRDFWHLRVGAGPFEGEWEKFGEQEQKQLDAQAKADAECAEMARLRCRIVSFFQNLPVIPRACDEVLREVSRKEKGEK